MKGEIIAIGDELTTGRTRDSNSAFAAKELFRAGHELLSIATIGDTPEEIGAMLKRAVARSDFVIVTGGLGATSDDLTNEAVSTALARPIVLYHDILQRLQHQTPVPGRHPMEKMAWLPEGSEILKPDATMAGHLLFVDGTPVFFLPGVPHEMRELMQDQVLPRLAVHGKQSRSVRQQVFKIHGLSETEINRRMADLEHGDGTTIGYYPIFPDVHLVLTVVGADATNLDAVFSDVRHQISRLLGDSIFATDNGTMEETVVRLLCKEKVTLSLAESCTGGMIASRITNVPGSSACFPGSVVAYSNQLKCSLLGVAAATLAGHGAVSEETAREMAAGIRQKTGADLGLSVTGIAGPDGGSPEKPVGTVYIALATSSQTRCQRFSFRGSRWQVREATCQEGLDLVRRLMADGRN